MPAINPVMGAGTPHAYSTGGEAAPAQASGEAPAATAAGVPGDIGIVNTGPATDTVTLSGQQASNEARRNAGSAKSGKWVDYALGATPFLAAAAAMLAFNVGFLASVGIATLTTVGVGLPVMWCLAKRKADGQSMTGSHIAAAGREIANSPLQPTVLANNWLMSPGSGT